MKNNFIYTCIIYKMSGLQFTYRYPGPPSQGVLIKNRGNNAIIDAQMGMHCYQVIMIHLNTLL